MSILSLVSDLIIIALCCGVATYCRIVHKRLDALRDIDTGLGAVIGRLNSGVNDMQSSFDATRKTVSKQGDRLRDIIDEGSSLAEYLHRLIKQAEATRHDGPTAAPRVKEVRKGAARVQPSLSPDFTSGGDPVSDVEPLGFEALLRRRMQQSPEGA